MAPRAADAGRWRLLTSEIGECIVSEQLLRYEGLASYECRAISHSGTAEIGD
jgi:hypothetical protein